MRTDVKINRGIVLRLAKYLRVLQKLKSLGFVKVFSNNLGDAVGVTPAVVRKDFSQINIPGNKRGGYNVDTLIENIIEVLGKDELQDIIVVGYGNIGHALINYRDFQIEGINVAACFDVRPEMVDREADVPILPMNEVQSFIREHGVQVAALAVPDNAATEVFDLLIEAGIRGVLNFTSVEVKCAGKCDMHNCPIKCVVQNVNIGLEIENLFYLVNMRNLNGCDDEVAGGCEDHD
ncbi:MAG: redox-sensing transcriptional repressor Rex [Spirochaetaceae bacterium]